ncbi:hypothetical protein CICLE_v10013269mg [Citrus x clementina]|uniref:Uncharacterized protein n=1 Tax=Citrus clementina TaxID=85681 RepID=V4UQP0_CITCL|nr:hypothetical protein CICLE_v10013269mg [Citrus x clementina]
MHKLIKISKTSIDSVRLLEKKHNQHNLIICNFFFSNWIIISIFVSDRSLVGSRSSILVGNVTSPLKAISEI